MGDPFRQPGESPTTAALAKLRALPTDPLRYLAMKLAKYREVPGADVPPRWITAARAEAMTPLGAAAEGIYPRFEKLVFIDDQRTTQAHLSTQGYFLATYFESGKCILTFGHPAATPSGDRVRVRSGSGSFHHDFGQHRIAVAEWIDAGETSILIPDMATVIALGQFYYLRVVPLRSAAGVVVSNPFLLGIIALVLLIAIRC